ncbi:MAG: M48 family metallopeptidase, partial [Rickettsiales bacterium]|nr:M48 family metallopeptidase [Rickettsiales bacterium]
MFATVGLQTQIWNNQLRSLFLLAGFPVLLLLMLAVFCGIIGAGNDRSHVTSGMDVFMQQAWLGVTQYGHYALLAAMVWFAVAYLFHGAMIRSATGAHAVSRTELPEIYNLLENLCISRGIPMPRLYVIDAPALNAFATGIDRKSYSITLTRGLMATLDSDEIEAVLAHELSHIINRDVRLLVISIIFVGIISFLCEMIFRMLVHSDRSDNRRNGAPLLIALLVLAVGYVFALVIRMALSRSREYLADAGAVALTKNPDAMIQALRKISGRSELSNVPEEVRQMFIDNHSAGFL